MIRDPLDEALSHVVMVRDDLQSLSNASTEVGLGPSDLLHAIDALTVTIGLLRDAGAQNTDTLIASALADAAEMPEGATIYRDLNMGGLAYRINDDETCDSGPIGHDADAYDEGDIENVIDALRNAGHDVA